MCRPRFESCLDRLQEIGSIQTDLACDKQEIGKVSNSGALSAAVWSGLSMKLLGNLLRQRVGADRDTVDAGELQKTGC